MQNLLKRPVTAPLLKSSVTGLVWRVSIRKISPGSSRAENPQDAIEYVARITPWPSSAVRSLLGLRKKRLDELPLFFGEFHAIPSRGG